MKKTCTRFIAFAALLTLVMLLVTACMPYGSTGTGTPAPTADPSVASEELQDIVLQNASVLSVNMLSPIAVAQFAGASSAMKAEDMDVTVTAYKIVGDEKIELGEDEYSFEVDSNGYIKVMSSELGEVHILVTGKVSGKTAEATIPVVRRSLTVWDIIMLGIGLYAFGMGITGKGRIYEEQFIKEGMEANYRMIVRIACIVIALLLIGSGIVAAVDTYGHYALVKNIIFGVAIVIIVAAMIATGRMVDKGSKKEAQEKAMAGRDLKAPSSAFDFDDDEPTIDEIKRQK